MDIDDFLERCSFFNHDGDGLVRAAGLNEIVEPGFRVFKETKVSDAATLPSGGTVKSTAPIDADRVGVVEGLGGDRRSVIGKRHGNLALEAFDHTRDEEEDEQEEDAIDERREKNSRLWLAASAFAEIHWEAFLERNQDLRRASLSTSREVAM